MISIRNMRKMDTGNVKAYYDVTINGIDIKGLKLIQSPKDGSMFLSYPSEKGKDDKYYNLVYISDLTLKKEVEDELKAMYNKK